MNTDYIHSTLAYSKSIFDLVSVMSFGCLVTFLLCQPVAVLAFKPNTHVWVGQQVLNDVVPDGLVTINGRSYAVAPEIVEALRRYPSDYRMGQVGPDAFPDPVVGQMTTHPGVPNAWKTDDWLRWVLRSGRSDPRMRAFAYGFAGHAAGDFFAHTYVNTYSGDVFVLSDGEQTNEKRHFAMESFIGKYTPPLTDHHGNRLGPAEDILSVPVDQVRDYLILNSEVQKQYEMPGTLAGHLVYMRRFRDTVDKTARAAKELPSKYVAQLSLLDAAKIEAARKADEYLGPIAQAKHNIAAAKLVLRGYDTQLELQQKAIDAARKGISDTQRAVRDLEEEKRKLEREIPEIQHRIDTMVNEIRYIPPRIAVRVCKDVCKWWDPFDWYCKYICETVSKVNEKWEELNNTITNAKRDVARKGVRLAQIPGEITSKLRDATVFEAAKLAAELEYQRIKALRDADRAGQAALDEATQKLNELERAKQQFLDRVVELNTDMNALKASLTINANPLYGALVAWRGWIDRAMEEYVKMSAEVAIELTKNSGNPMRPIMAWFSCWAAVFLAPVPSQICEVRNFLVDVFDRISGIREDIRRRLGIFGWLVDPLGMLSDLAERELRPIAIDTGLKIAGFVLGKETQFLLEVIVKEVDDNNLDGIFSSDDSGKNFLIISDVARRVRTDMSVGDGSYFDPLKFNAVANAVTLAKLTLLGPDQLSRLSRDLGVEGDDLFRLVNDFNILVGAVRSIDGNHQWNEYAPPYLRRNGVRDLRKRDARTYGYPDGFRLWSNDEARKKIFSKIFSGPIAPAMETPEKYGFTRLVPKDYPYKPTEKNPFPKVRDYSDQDFGSWLKKLFN